MVVFGGFEDGAAAAGEFEKVALDQVDVAAELGRVGGCESLFEVSLIDGVDLVGVVA